jgi:hypothetical protein
MVAERIVAPGGPAGPVSGRSPRSCTQAPAPHAGELYRVWQHDDGASEPEAAQPTLLGFELRIAELACELPLLMSSGYVIP